VSFSDQQLITGISIIIGGVSQLSSGLSVYHWFSVINLAWFSSVTHLLTITVLRSENSRRKLITKLRVVGMSILAVMLISIIAPIGTLVSYQNRIPIEFPAWCLYHGEMDWKSGHERIGKSYNWLYQIFAIGFLLYSLFTGFRVLLFKGSFRKNSKISKPCQQSPIKKIQERIDQETGFRRFWNKAWLKTRYSLLAFRLAVGDVYFSKTWEVIKLFQW